VSKLVSLALVLLALMAFSSFASAQATTVCQSTFASPGGLFSLQFCVTGNGNIAQYATPIGLEHIRTGTIGEGYGICDLTSGVEYADYSGGGATANWLAPVINQPGGPNTFPLSIFRTTSDGVWQLRQTFTRSVGDRAVKIKMELFNQTAVARSVNLLRYADLDANAQPANMFQATVFSATASNINQVGIQLRDAGKKLNTPIVQTIPGGPQPCTPAANASGTAFVGNGSVELVYQLTVPKNNKKTVTVLYRPF
jgi:hypothetical protein